MENTQDTRYEIRADFAGSHWLLIPAQEQCYHVESGAPYRLRPGWLDGRPVVGYATCLFDAQAQFPT